MTTDATTSAERRSAAARQANATRKRDVIQRVAGYKAHARKLLNENRELLNENRELRAALGREGKVDKPRVHRVGLVLVAGELALRGARVAEARTAYGPGLRATWPDGCEADVVVMATSQSRWQFGDVRKLDTQPTERATFFALTDVSAPIERTYVVPAVRIGEIARAAEQHWRDQHGGGRPENDGSRHVLVEPGHVVDYDGRWDIMPC